MGILLQGKCVFVKETILILKKSTTLQLASIQMSPSIVYRWNQTNHMYKKIAHKVFLKAGGNYKSSLLEK